MINNKNQHGKNFCLLFFFLSDFGQKKDIVVPNKLMAFGKYYH